MSIERSSGILLHISSLPNQYGIGTFGKTAYEFVDFLQESGQTYWQILPLNPVAEGNSPYSTYSAFALNPYFIDLDLLARDGLLREIDYQHIDFGSDPNRVDYSKIYENKMRVLRLAYENSREKMLDGWSSFIEHNGEWLYDYAKFMGFRFYFKNSLQNWGVQVKRKNIEPMENYHSLIGQDEEHFWLFLQYICHKQWMSLKKYANDNNIRIFGDMPIYVSGDSADVWANPEVFDVDVDLNPQHVAGCPPDDFAVDGQRWGMPVFNWEYLENTDFDWWMKRIHRNLHLYDVKCFVQSYLDTYEEYNIGWKCIEKVMSSESKLSIIQMQDFLQLGSEARMNIPGTTYGNWEWRVNQGALHAELAKKIHDTTKKYNR